MVDAVRLVVDQHAGVAGQRARARARARRRGQGADRDRARALRRATPRRAAADPGALAVIGTYELACSEARAAGAAARRPAGWSRRSTPPTRCRVRSAWPRARATRALRRRSSPTRSGPHASPWSASGPGAETAFASALIAAAPDAGIGPVLELDASAATPQELVGELRDAQIQVVALAGSPGTWATDLLRALALLPDAVRPAVVAPESVRHARVHRRSRRGCRRRARDLAARAGGAARRQRAQLRERLRGPARAAAAGGGVRGRRRRGRARRRRQRGRLARAGGGGARGAARARRAARPLGRDARRAASRRGASRCSLVDGGAFRVERVVTVSDPLPSSGEVK